LVILGLDVDVLVEEVQDGEEVVLQAGIVKQTAFVQIK
jgi:hypothetical protein